MKSSQKRKCIVRRFLFTVLITLFLPQFHSLATASVADSPTNGWQTSSPEAQGMDSKKLAHMMAHIKEENLNIDSISIVRNGQMVLDANFHPFTGDRTHNMFSCTKSVMSALIGIAVGKGCIKSVTQPITDFFEDREIANMDGLKESITLENLLTMTSGLECRDSYLYQWAGLVEMRKSRDWTKHVLDLPMAGPPGKEFEYCNGNSHLLSAIIQNTTNMTTLEFARKYLFDPLDIVDIHWETSPKGIENGYDGMWLTPHDLAKFGQLYLNKGVWGNKQIIPSKWVEVSTRGHIDANIFKRYGYHWWVDSTGFWWFNSSEYFIAVGSNGQCIYVLPEKKIVVVITSNMKEKRALLIINKLIHRYIVPAASSRKTLPSNPKEQDRLNARIKDAAQSMAQIWNSEDEGFAHDGMFKHISSPTFQFEYPVMSHKAEINNENQVMRMYFDVDGFSASVVDIPDGIELEEFGPVFYARNNFLEKSSNVRVVGNSKILLACGAEAYRTEITWRWNNSLPITTYLVSAYKDGKCIFIDARAWKHHDKLESMVQSLTFK